MKQAAYVAECKPIDAWDVTILKAYGEGRSLNWIADEFKMSEGLASWRIRSCHPEMKSLK